mgnify:FL=1|jgi:proteic killer suppression protein
MNIEYKSKKLKRCCEDPRFAQATYGLQNARKLIQRIGEFDAAVSLSDIANNPAARLHKLEGKRRQQYAVDLEHPFRLVFTPIVTGDAEHIHSLEKIQVIRIEEVVNYHGKQK